jgi:hypothetical protein
MADLHYDRISASGHSPAFEVRRFPPLATGDEDLRSEKDEDFNEWGAGHHSIEFELGLDFESIYVGVGIIHPVESL